MHFCRFKSTLDSLKRVFKVPWNPVNTVTNEPKHFARINGVAVLTRVFEKKKYGGFCQAAKKNWP